MHIKIKQLSLLTIKQQLTMDAKLKARVMLQETLYLIRKQKRVCRNNFGDKTVTEFEVLLKEHFTNQNNN